MREKTSSISRILAVGSFLFFSSMGCAQQLQPPTQTMGTKIGDFRDGFLWILNAQGNGQYQPGVDHVAGYGGLPGDIPVVGNWKGTNPCAQGCFNVGVYRSSTLSFLLDTNGNFFVDAGDQYFSFSIPGLQSSDIPVVGDWNGDYRTKVGLYRPSTCEWFLDYDGDHVWNPSIDKHYQPSTCHAGDVPVVGDWDGHGTSKIGVYRAGTWVVDLDGYGNYYDVRNFGYFGGVPDIPVVGSWMSGSRNSFMGVVQGDYLWMLDAGDQQLDAYSIIVAYGGGGSNTDIPVVGNWTKNPPVVNATPDFFNVTVSGVNQGANGSAPAGTPAQFAFTFHDEINGANAIWGGSVYFQDPSGTGPQKCYLNWSPGTYPTSILWYTYNQSDSNCTITNPNITYSATDPSLMTMTINITFNTVAIGSYTVNSMVYDGVGSTSGWGQSGTFAVAGGLLITANPPSPAVALVGVPYTANFTAAGGTGHYTYSLQGSLPPGLTFSSGGAISGTPTAVGTLPPFTVVANDTGTANATLLQSITVVDPLTNLSISTRLPAKEYIRFNDRVVAISGSPCTMTGTKAAVFRGGTSYLADTNGNCAYDAGIDHFISTFSPPGGHAAGDVPVIGDWTGDGHAKVGLYRPSAGTWWLDASNDGIFGAGDYTYQFGGLAGDLPFVGDWSAIGRSCIGIYRAQGSVWLLDLNCNGSFDDTPKDAFFPFGGLSGDVPVVGAWFGGTTHVGVVRKYAPAGIPQGNPFFWVLDAGEPNAGNPPANHQAAANFSFAFGGLPGDVYLSGDWYSTGEWTAGVYRNGLWVLDSALPGAPIVDHVPGWVFGYGGIAGDIPVPGKWLP